MTMRQAKVEDHWRHAMTRLYPTRVESIEVVDSTCLADGTIRCVPSITAIVGGNGVGKSTFAVAVAEVLSGVENKAELSDNLSRVIGSTTTATAFVDRVSGTYRVAPDASGRRVFSDPAFAGHFRWLEPSSFAQDCVRRVRDDTNFQDLLDPLTPAELVGEDLEVVSYLVGKDYTQCRIYEVEYEEFGRFPYFQVTSADVTYGSESMGRGELSLFLTYWVLRDLPRCSILILEEPETHVSPRSQDRLMNVVAKYCDEKAISVITTTHSPTIIRRLPRENVLLVTAGGQNGSVVIATPSLTQVATVLSGGVALKGALLVEDETAQAFLMLLLEELAPDLLPQFELLVAGSDSHIRKVIESFPRTKDWLTLVGVFDGDIQITAAETLIWPAVNLPGNAAPEKLLRDMMKDGAVQTAFAGNMGRLPHDISLAIGDVAGVDDHEWIRQLSSVIGRGHTFVRQSLMRTWIQANLDATQGFVEALRRILEQAGR